MHVITSLEIGGAEMLLVNLLTRLPATPSDTVVVTLRRRGQLADRVEKLGVPVLSLDVPMRRGAWALGRHLAVAIGRTQPDIVHSHNSSPLVASALALPRGSRTPLVHTEHGRAAPRGLPARIAVRLAGRRAAAIIAVSNDTATWARKHLGLAADRIRVIRNGVPIPPAATRRPHGVRAVTVTRLEPVKDIGTMLQAVSAIRKALPGFRLDIYGDGSERSRLTSMAGELGLADAVVFHGMTDQPACALVEADVFLSSSVSEGISLTILDAMAAGLPVVATAVGGTPELIEDGVHGRLVPSGRPDLFADAVVAVLADTSVAAAMGAAGRQRAQADFSIDTMVEQYRELYRSL